MLGTLQFYSRFTPKLSSIAAPLYSLLSPAATFSWTSQCEDAFRSLIREISFSDFIVPYNIREPLFLTTDASGQGLGAVLSHDSERKRIISCASRTLSPAEKQYANIEREALAIVFGVQRFHKYLAGRHFVLQTDHSPLRYIFDTTKALKDRISARLQRWGLILKGYDFSISDVRGNQMYLPDLLSRLDYPNAVSKDELDLNFIMNESEIPMFEEIQRETQDSDLRHIIRFTQKGWPTKVNSRLFPYTKAKDNYTVHNSCLYYGMRIVIPGSMRNKLLHYFHDFHAGINKMRQIMRTFVWWPNMDMEIQKFVNQCQRCNMNQASKENDCLKSWPDSHAFFDRIFTDICFIDNKCYLILVDHFSGFVDVHKLHSLSTASVISTLRKTFKYFGLPKQIVCDNGACFRSKEFSEFLMSNDIDVCYTPPYHSQSNGKVERAIRSFKLFAMKNSNLPDDLCITKFCMTSNFLPNSNGIIPAKEYMNLKPRTLMRKAIISDKKGAREVQIPNDSCNFPGTVIPSVRHNVHRGTIVNHDTMASDFQVQQQEYTDIPVSQRAVSPRRSIRQRRDNKFIFNSDFVTK